MRCPKCGTNNPPEEQLTYCKKCGTELRVVCPRCSADNPGHAEYCGECGLELHPDRGHERAAGIRVDADTAIVAGVLKKRPTFSAGVLAAAVGVLVVVWIPIFFTLKKRAQFTGCQTHLKQIALAMQAYAHDYGGNAPSAYDWSTTLLHYLPDRNALICPSRSDKIGYGFNLNLNEVPLSRLNNSGTLIAFFEARGDKSISGTQSMWLSNPAHAKGNNLVFVDGTVRQSLNTPADQFWSASSATAPPPPAPVTAPEANASTPENSTNGGTLPNASGANASGHVLNSQSPPGQVAATPLPPGANPPPPGANPSAPGANPSPVAP